MADSWRLCNGLSTRVVRYWGHCLVVVFQYPTSVYVMVASCEGRFLDWVGVGRWLRTSCVDHLGLNLWVCPTLPWYFSEDNADIWRCVGAVGCRDNFIAICDDASVSVCLALWHVQAGRIMQLIHLYGATRPTPIYVIHLWHGRHGRLWLIIGLWHIGVTMCVVFGVYWETCAMAPTRQSNSL